MDKGGKKRSGHYDKRIFSDEEIQDEIRDEIREIKQSRMNEVDQLEKIDKLYRERKQIKKRRKMMQKGSERKLYSHDNRKEEMHSESDQPGQINQELPKRRQRESNQQQLTTKQLGQLIKQVTLTRKKLVDFLDNRKFEDLVKGCFVRYKSDSSSKEESYIIAQIIGVKQGNKQYALSASHRTKLLLVLQQSNLKVVQLPIEMVSNQAISGSIEINKWISQNSDKIPKERQIKEKLEQHSRLLTEQLSSQQIDKNIENRAIAFAKGNQEVKSLEDLQNLIDFIVQKIENYEVQQEQEVAKRKQGNVELIQIKRRKFQYNQIRKLLEEKKKHFLETRGASEKKQSQTEEGQTKDKNQKGLAFKIQEKRQDAIKQKWRHREMLLCTAEGYQKIKMNMLQNHSKYDIELDV